MLPEAKLVRIVKPRVEVQDGAVVVVEKVETVCVKFYDCDGIERVSLAFDGRADHRTSEYGSFVCEEYSVLADCPVMSLDTDDPDYRFVQHGATRHYLRGLRDALNEMDLDDGADHNDTAICSQCGGHYCRADFTSSCICGECWEDDE